MKNLFIASLLLFIVQSNNAQIHTNNSISLNIDFDAGAHLALYKPNFNGTAQPTDSSGAGTTLFRINPQYHILGWLSAGLDFRFGGYIEDPENAEAAGNSIRTTTLFVRAFPVNKDKFSWYVGLGFGMSALEIKRRFTFFIPVLAEYQFRGGQSFFETGINVMATKTLGFNFGLNYMGTNMKLRKYILNGESQNISNWNNYMNTKGLTFSLGLTLAFLNNK